MIPTQKHISWDQYALFLLPTKVQGGALVAALLISPDTISMNLMDFYNDLAINENSVFDVSNVNVSKLYLFNGDPDDIILAAEDQSRIFNSANVPVELGFNYTLIPFSTDHVSIKSKDKIKIAITSLLEVD